MSEGRGGVLGGLFGRRAPREVAAVSPEVAQALVRADETLRRGTQEHGFATAEFGESAARELGEALPRAKDHLQEAFRLNALLLDDEPETPEERARLEAGVLAATAEVDRLVRGAAGALVSRRAALQEAPATVARLRAEAADVATRVEGARAAVGALTARYGADAVVAVADGPEQAEALLGFTERSLALAERRHADGRGDEATKAIQVASDSVRRAADLLDGVTDYEVEVVQAESTLAEVLADSRGDVAEARQLLAARPDAELKAATDALATAVETAAGRGADDPFTTLSGLRAANGALEQLVQHRRQAPERERLRAHLERALADAERQVGRARAIVSEHPGYVGPDARTRLAQAERLLDGVTSLDDPQAALAQARQAADLASEASALAERDLHGAQQGGPDWGGGWGGGGWGGGGRGAGGMGGVLGGVLGGMVLGGILDDIDLDFD